MAAEEESFVNIGTAFDVPDEDAPKKKALPVHEQFATDNEGRRRFHGAFTGGFSAGYFNTVGSKEGWKPSTFVSSRSKRFESSYQRPEDFMDEEDLGEFGIAPRKVETTRLFSPEQTEAERKQNQHKPHNVLTSRVTFDAMVLSTLQDLVVPCQMSIGVKLLKKMGWKEGQGIGPRVRQLASKKVYGCILPPGLATDERGGSEHDIYAEGLLFAPKDTMTVKFTPKDNLHGIGYKGMMTPKPLQVSKPGFSGNLKIKGQAFGVGAFEDDDEDVYTQDSISNYDIEIHEIKSSHSDLHGWTGPPEEANKGGALSMFAQASRPKRANKVFPPPSIPKGYQPFINIKETYHVKKDEEGTARLTSDVRGKLLGEQPLKKSSKSIFDLMSKEDKERIASTKRTLQTNIPAAKNPSNQQLSNVHALGFQPFAKDPAKQARYECFLESRKSGAESNTTNESRYGLTEWEREREKEEFSRAAMLYQPLKGSIAARFTRGRNIDDDVSDKDNSNSDQTNSVEEKAAKMKMFGKLTRKTFEWHPSKLLCKRFNIPEPYPSSSKTGLVSEKKEKFTLGQLFETSRKNENDETTYLNKLTNDSNNPPTVSNENAISKNLNTEEKSSINSTSSEIVSFKQKEKPSMDLFKAIFADSSEDESESSEDEDLNNEHSSQIQMLEDTPSADLTTAESKLQTNAEHTIYSNAAQTSAKASNTQYLKSNSKQDNTEDETMQSEEEYGPRPPPAAVQVSDGKLELQFPQTVPFSHYPSNSSDSDNDKPKRKHKKKQKHKSKHKNKNKEKDKVRSRKREKDKLTNNDTEIPKNSWQKSSTSHEQSDKLNHKEIPDDKQILSRLKAVQKRRMCAADFM